MVNATQVNLSAASGLNNIVQVPLVKKQLKGYVGFHNLPNQVHKKSLKKGFQFTLMVVGESGLGKSTLVNTLFNTTLYPSKDAKEPSHEVPKTVEIQTISAGMTWPAWAYVY